MNRRGFIAGTGLAATASLATALPKPAIAQDKIEWKMVTSWLKGMPGLGSSAERLADRIGKMSGGRLTVRVYAAGELVPATQCFDAVSKGTAEIGHDSAQYHAEQTPAAGFFAAVPFGLTAAEFNGWINFGGGQELWEELYDPFGVRPFLAGNTGVQMGGWYRKEITALKDFKGLKICMSGYGGEVLRKFGATPISLPSGEIFGNLQSGAIDAAEWVGPYNDLSLGLYKVTKLYYWPGFHEPGSALQCIVNKAKYNALPDDLKQIVAAACAAENDITQAEYYGRSPAALATLVSEYKVQLKQYPREVLLAIGTVAGETMQEILDNGTDITKRVGESYFKFRKLALQWNKVADSAYASARAMKFDFPQG